jgi:hypothetical protein
LADLDDGQSFDDKQLVTLLDYTYFLIIVVLRMEQGAVFDDPLKRRSWLLLCLEGG